MVKKVTVTHDAPADPNAFVTAFNGPKKTEREKCGIQNSQLDRNTWTITHDVADNKKAKKHVSDWDNKRKEAKAKNNPIKDLPD